MEVRELKRNELDDLLNLYSYLHEDDDPLPPREQVEALWHQIVDNHCLSYLGVFVDGLLVSSCNLTIVPNLTRGCRPFALIENVVTIPDFREQGYGQKVIKEAVFRSRNENCYKVMLYTGSKKDSVHSFYRNLGFSASGKTAYIMKF